MPDTTLGALLERNRRHTDRIGEGYFDAVLAGQEPAVVSMCCSDSRVSQEGMWAVEEPGWLFSPSTIGNQVWDRHDGKRVVDGSVLYPLVRTGTSVVAVVGHTGCGAITAALEAVRETEPDLPDGIAKWIDELKPVVDAGLDYERVDPNRDVELVDQLVEFNVDRQVEFLRDSGDVPEDVSIYGFVYDFQGVYGGPVGRTYLVNAEGETEPAALRDRVPDRYDAHVHRLL